MNIDASRMYANDGNANPAFWTVLPGGTHGKIVAALTADMVVTAAIQAKFTDPNNDAKRAFVIDHINRATVNCIGEVIAKQPIAPEASKFTIYNLLSGGTAAAIDAVLADVANVQLHAAFAAQSASQVIDTISRQTGRALFHEVLGQIHAASHNPVAIISTLENLLKAQVNAVTGL